MGGISIDVTSADDSDAFVSLILGESVGVPGTELERVVLDLQGRVPDGNVTLNAPVVSFETGTDLNRFSDAVGQPYDMKDVSQ